MPCQGILTDVIFPETHHRIGAIVNHFSGMGMMKALYKYA
jgi:hypothetical protein